MNKMQIVKNDTTKEVGNMVKKAENLNSLDELGLSSRTRTYLLKNFDAIDTIVIVGRELAFELEVSAMDTKKCPKWVTELTSALRRSGFIRPATDFVMSLRVGRLYGFIFQDYKEYFVTHITSLTNEEYEKFTSITKPKVANVKASLLNRLNEKEYVVVCRWFGLEGDDRMGLASIAQFLGIPREHVRHILVKALNKLKHRNTFSISFDAPGTLNRAVKELKDELDELYRNPVFQREQEILTELERIGKLPFRYCDEVSEYLESLFDSSELIEDLNLSIRTYNCLKRAGINTVYNILNRPNDRWAEVKNLGRHSMEEIVEKMHSAGYTDFVIDI